MHTSPHSRRDSSMQEIEPVVTSHRDNPGRTIRGRHYPERILKGLTGARNWRWAVGAISLFFTISVVSILFASWVTPSKSIDTLGQHFTVRSTAPDWSFSGHGEITVNTGTPQTFYLLPTKYYGPIRVHLSVDAPFQGSDLLNKATIDHNLPAEASAAFEAGFRSWLINFVALTMGTGLVLSASAAFILLLLRSDRRRDAVLLVVRSMTTTFVHLVVVSTLFVCGSLSIAKATSLDALVGHSALHLQAPRAAGPDIKGYDAVSIGDSRSATQGGKPLKNPSREDSFCRRSSDSLADQIGRFENWKVLNLSCSGATIAAGLMDKQPKGDEELTAQVSVVKKMTNIKVVFVTIGPNDLWWSRAIGLCYLSDVCNDNLTTPDYQALLEKFKWDYHDLLFQLQNLANGPNGSRPEIIINGSYDVLQPGDSCAATKGLTADKISMLTQRNADLNKALEDGASMFGFKFVPLHLKMLCDKLTDAPGAEIRPPTDPDAFHPTDTGVMVMAMADVMALST